jgi:hypothetical protein
MGSIYLELDEGLREFIRAQRVYFVATAPLSASGHINVAPKGLEMGSPRTSRRKTGKASTDCPAPRILLSPPR